MNYFHQLAASLAYLLTLGLLTLAGMYVVPGSMSMSNAVLRSACYATGFGLVAVLGCKAYRLEFPAELTNRETALRVRYLGIIGGVAIGVLVIFGAMFSYIPLFNAIFGVACSGAFVLSACLLFRSSYSSLLLLLVGVFLMAFVVGMALNAQVFYAAPTDPNQID